MATIYLTQIATPEDIKVMSEALGDYIKIVIDVTRDKVAGGSSLHADIERVFLAQGSRQDDIWGGGLDLLTGELESIAMVNLRATRGNASQEILDPVIRSKFLAIARKYFRDV